MTPVTRRLTFVGLICTVAALGMGFAGIEWWGAALVWGGALLLAGAINEHNTGGK